MPLPIAIALAMLALHVILLAEMTTDEDVRLAMLSAVSMPAAGEPTPADTTTSVLTTDSELPLIADETFSSALATVTDEDAVNAIRAPTTVAMLRMLYTLRVTFATLSCSPAMLLLSGDQAVISGDVASGTNEPARIETVAFDAVRPTKP